MLEQVKAQGPLEHVWSTQGKHQNTQKGLVRCISWLLPPDNSQKQNNEREIHKTMEKPEMQAKAGIQILLLVIVRRQLRDDNCMLTLYREPTKVSFTKDTEKE